MKTNRIKTAKGFKDTFNLYMIKQDSLFGNLELPYVQKYKGPVPNKLKNYLSTKLKEENTFIHFYLFDYNFDNKDGLWYGSLRDSIYVQKFLNKLKGFGGAISPDYSVYVDMPLIMQLWNIYRTRTVCCWLNSIGVNCILNLRWGDYRTYEVVFSGIAKHSTFSIGSHGLIKNPVQRHIFMNGFQEMLNRLNPEALIIYGPYTKEMNELCDKYSVKVYHFESEQTEARR